MVVKFVVVAVAVTTRRFRLEEAVDPVDGLDEGVKFKPDAHEDRPGTLLEIDPGPVHRECMVSGTCRRHRDGAVSNQVARVQFKALARIARPVDRDRAT